tara:strand:- start:128 stop:301 length:174 start_codon:yes stop_codon:yes gene_type:complete
MYYIEITTPNYVKKSGKKTTKFEESITFDFRSTADEFASNNNIHDYEVCRVEDHEAD